MYKIMETFIANFWKSLSDLVDMSWVGRWDGAYMNLLAWYQIKCGNFANWQWVLENDSFY